MRRRKTQRLQTVPRDCFQGTALLVLFWLIAGAVFSFLGTPRLFAQASTNKPGAAQNPPEDDSPAQDGGSVGSLPEWLISRSPVPKGPHLPPGWDFFPVGTFFLPPLADLREPRMELSLLRMDLPDETRLDGLAFIGDTFGFLEYAWAERGPGDSDGFQIGAQALANPQVGFSDDLRGDLINVDFVLGPAFSLRQGNFSARARFYHQSSHLGDEFVEERPLVQRVNLSFEALEGLVSYAYGPWRAYGGGAYKVHIDPNGLKRGELHFGVECRTRWRVLVIGRFVFAYDVHFFELHDWGPDQAVVAGLELRKSDPLRRNVKILLEYYRGHGPFGQLFLEEKAFSFFGLGLRFSY
ncbi:MAG: DUF1207 domain-containing protein [Bdellovibrionota bacterium]